MGKINEVKLELRYHAWSEQIQKCQQSGMSIRKWCAANNVKPKVINDKAENINGELNNKIFSFITYYIY